MVFSGFYAYEVTTITRDSAMGVFSEWGQKPQVFEP